LESEIVILEEEKKDLESEKQQNDDNILEVTSDRDGISINIISKQGEIDNVDDEINENSDKKSSITATVELYGKNFRLKLDSEVS
jgi:chromosome segregation ATPase